MRKLEIGYNHPFEVRRESCVVMSGRQSVMSGRRPDTARCYDDFTVLFLSDLHLNKYSGQTVADIINKIEEINPTIILFGGDYVDSKQGLNFFGQLLESISHRSFVFAIAGNHDEFHGTNELKTIARRNNVVWIENQSVKFRIENTSVRIDAGKSTSEENDDEVSILVLHNPREIEKLKRKYDLAFAGHLHGSQFVFWQKENALYPGRLFYKWNVLKTMLNGTSYFISKGLGDTMTLRYNCKRDMIFVQVTSQSI